MIKINTRIKAGMRLGEPITTDHLSNYGKHTKAIGHDGKARNVVV